MNDPRQCKCGLKARVFFAGIWLCDLHADELIKVTVEQEQAISGVRRTIADQMPSEPCAFCGRIDNHWHGRTFEPLVCTSCWNELGGSKGVREHLTDDHPAKVKRTEKLKLETTVEKRPTWLLEMGAILGAECVRKADEASRR